MTRCDLHHPLESGSEPCPRCMSLHRFGGLWLEMVRPLPEAAPPLGPDGASQCHDCSAADDLIRRLSSDSHLRAYLATRSQRLNLASDEDVDVDENEPRDEEGDAPGGAGMSWVMARVAVGNDRLEQYRLPGAPMGLAHPSHRLVRYSHPGDLQKLHAWLLANDLGTPDGGFCRNSIPKFP